jgi:hypothetical protein
LKEHLADSGITLQLYQAKLSKATDFDIKNSHIFAIIRFPFPAFQNSANFNILAIVAAFVRLQTSNQMLGKILRLS